MSGMRVIMRKHMQQQITFHGRKLELNLTPAAAAALAKRQTPLLAEMELYFSCLIRKSVRFYETAGRDCTPVNDTLSLCFRPVMTRHCGLDYEGEEPPLTDFPISRAERYIPHWLSIDYQNGQWNGEFGYAKP
jgi:hypothetical protein